MYGFECLSRNFYGVEIFRGEIDLSKERAIIFFFIVEHTNEKDFIFKQALQLLLAGSRQFIFFGKQKLIWHTAFDKLHMKMFPNNSMDLVAVTSKYETIADFADEIALCIRCKYLVPTDIYLVYDDEETYQSVLKMLGKVI